MSRKKQKPIKNIQLLEHDEGKYHSECHAEDMINTQINPKLMELLTKIKNRDVEVTKFWRHYNDNAKYMLDFCPEGFNKIWFADIFVCSVCAEEKKHTELSYITNNELVCNSFDCETHTLNKLRLPTEIIFKYELRTEK